MFIASPDYYGPPKYADPAQPLTTAGEDEELLRGTIIIRTCHQCKNLYIPRFLHTIFGPDYYVPR